MARQFNTINGNVNVYIAKGVSKPGWGLAMVQEKVVNSERNVHCIRMHIYLEDPRSIVTANSEHKDNLGSR